jgi:cholesterol transport system auxiliary component
MKSGNMRMTDKRALSCLAMAPVLGLALALSACASAPPKDTYGLTAAAVITGPARGRRQVLIAQPVAVQMLDSDNIVVRVSGQEFQYLGSSQWSDKLPKVVQLKLAQAFENSGKVAGAGLPGEGLAIDYQVQTNIRAFEVSVANGTANVEIAARLLNDRTGQVRASKVFRASVPVTGAGDKGGVAALDRAFGQVSSELVSWALAAM